MCSDLQGHQPCVGWHGLEAAYIVVRNAELSPIKLKRDRVGLGSELRTLTNLEINASPCHTGLKPGWMEMIEVSSQKAESWDQSSIARQRWRKRDRELE
jgi:hypothetical protein